VPAPPRCCSGCFRRDGISLVVDLPVYDTSSCGVFIRVALGRSALVTQGVMKNTRTIGVAYTPGRSTTAKCHQRREHPEQHLGGRRRNRLIPPRSRTPSPARQHEQPFQGSRTSRSEWRQIDLAERIASRPDRLSPPPYRHRARQAGDGQADAHVVVDAQHVGAQTGVDGRVNAPGGPAEGKRSCGLVDMVEFPLLVRRSARGLRRRLESISDTAIC